MGIRDRERITRIKEGKETSIRDKILNNPVTKSILKHTSVNGVKQELLRGDVSEQTSKLNTLMGEGLLPDWKLKQTIMAKAPGEMDKAIKKYQKQGKSITVDTLLSELRSEKGFLQTCERCGLDYTWFTGLAKERMDAKGIIS
jgi:hypothetical protein